MSELRKRFDELRTLSVNASDLIILWYAARGMKYPRPMIYKVFNQVVDKEEYDQCDKTELIDYIYNYSNEQQ